jgi:hypothetical protein
VRAGADELRSSACWGCHSAPTGIGARFAPESRHHPAAPRRGRARISCMVLRLCRAGLRWTAPACCAGARRAREALPAILADAARSCTRPPDRAPHRRSRTPIRAGRVLGVALCGMAARGEVVRCVPGVLSGVTKVTAALLTHAGRAAQRHRAGLQGAGHSAARGGPGGAGRVLADAHLAGGVRSVRAPPGAAAADARHAPRDAPAAGAKPRRFERAPRSRRYQAAHVRHAHPVARAVRLGMPLCIRLTHVLCVARSRWRRARLLHYVRVDRSAAPERRPGPRALEDPAHAHAAAAHPPAGGHAGHVQRRSGRHARHDHHAAPHPR